MNKQITLIIGLLILASGIIILNKNSQNIPVYDWENHTVFNINREKPRAHFIPYESEKYALIGEPKRSKFYISLNGKWKFFHSKTQLTDLKIFIKLNLIYQIGKQLMSLVTGSFRAGLSQFILMRNILPSRPSKNSY